MPEPSLLERQGRRNHLTVEEQDAFLAACDQAPLFVGTFGKTPLYTGCRLSEAHGLTEDRIDLKAGFLVFETLMRRQGASTAPCRCRGTASWTSAKSTGCKTRTGTPGDPGKAARAACGPGPAPPAGGTLKLS